MKGVTFKIRDPKTKPTTKVRKMKQNFRKVSNGRNYSIHDAKISGTKPKTMRWIKRDVAKTVRRQIKNQKHELDELAE